MSWTNGYISVNYNFFPCWLALYALVLLLVVECSRRFYVIQVLLYWIVPFIMPAIMIFYNIYENSGTSDDTSTPFTIIKLCSVVVAIWIIQLIRHQLHRFGSTWTSILIWSMYVILMINIMEAVVTEFVYWLNNPRYTFPGNTIHGIILILLQPNPVNITASDDTYSSIRYKLGAMYIFNYTVWNIIFVYNYLECQDWNHFLLLIRAFVLHLGVPLIMLIWTHIDEWIQYRAYALMMFFWLYDMPKLKYYVPFFMMPPNLCEQYEEELLWQSDVLNGVSFVLGLLFMIKQIYEEVQSWSGIKKSTDSSIIQWVISKCKPKKQMDLIGDDSVDNGQESETVAMI